MDNSVNVQLKYMKDGAKLPLYATSGSAAADLYCALDSDCEIKPGETVLIPTGIAIGGARAGVVALIFARSGISVKHGIAPANCVGVIDSDYRGEIKVGLHNHSNEAYVVKPGERIAQLMFVPVLRANFGVVTELDETDRGDGGFGSTKSF